MVHTDLFCSVQPFASSNKKDKYHGDGETHSLNNDVKSSSNSSKKNYSRKLSFSFRKKSPSYPSSGTVSPQCDKSELSPLHYKRSSGYGDMTHNQEVSVEQQAAAAAAAEEILTNTPGSSKARQKKFHRQFNELPQEEKVINYFSCALIGEVLIHGHLYITKNFIAFYSNHFGNINKILIPTTTILKITKEKTAISKPNVVAIITMKEKYLFGLFLSRDTTYKLMVQVWNSALKPYSSQQYLSLPSKESIKDNNSSSVQDQLSCNEDESSLSGSEINLIGSPDLLRNSYIRNYNKSPNNTDITTNSGLSKSSSIFSGIDESCQTTQPPLLQVKTKIILGTSTILLVILFISAGILLYRINCLQQNYTHNRFVTTTRSVNEIQEFLNLNLHYITQVRKSLEALSAIIDQETLSNVQQNIDVAAKSMQN